MSVTPDGYITYSTKLDNKQLEKDLAKATKDVDRIEGQLYKNKEKRLPIANQVAELGAKLDEAKAKLASLQAESQRTSAAISNYNINDPASISAFSEAKGRQPALEKELTAAQKAVDGLQAKFDTAATKLEAVDQNAKKLEADLNTAKDKAGGIADQLSKPATASEKMGVALGHAEKQMYKFTHRVAGLAKRVLVFSVILRLLRGLVQWFGEAIKASPEARDAIADLKGALLTLAQPLVDVFIPAFTDLVTLLSRVITMIARVVSFVFGKTADQSREAAKALNEQMDALDGVGGSAKKAGKSLAGFDEINQFSGDSGAGGASSTDIKPDLSGIRGAMSELEVYMSGALLSLGAILAFAVPGQMPLGIGLMAVGAMGLASALAVDWDSMPNNLKNAITKTMLVLGSAALAIGAILTFAVPGHMALGIGLMIAGAAALGSAVALNWGAIVETLTAQNGLILGILSGSLLTVGAILAFCGYLPLGIGLMAAGAVGLAATAALNWDSIIEALKGPVGGVTALVSGALLAIGAIIAFTGAGLPLGIGLMAAGAIGLASVVAVNWGTIKEKIKPVIASILGILSGASLALGVLLCLSGAGIGLGLALIFAGLAGTKAAFNLDDNPITRFVKKLANGIISIINKVIDKVNQLFHIKFKGLNIGGVQVVPSFDAKLINLPRIPMLAQGAVIPPNREFMAVLGDQKRGYNIEAPEDLIRKIVREEANGGEKEIYITIVTNLDGREVARNQVKHINDMTRQAGKPVLLF